MISCVCPASHPICLACQKVRRWALRTNCSTTLFHTCHADRLHWLLLLCTAFLDLGWRSQYQWTEIHIGFIFWHTFQLIKMKFDGVHPSHILKEGKYMLFYRLKKNSVGMYLNVYKLSLFNLGMTDNIAPNILTSFSDLVLDSKPQRCEKVKSDAPFV